MKRTSSSVVFFTVFFMANIIYAAQDNWMRIADEIEKALHDAVKSYEANKTGEAMEKVAEAYFGIFEGEKANMEIAVRRFISLKKAAELEKGFSDLRKAMFSKTPLSDIKKQTVALIEGVKATAKELNRKGVGLGNCGF